MNLSDYSFDDECGFLLPFPLANLPIPFDQWVHLAEKIPSLIEKNLFREQVEKLPLLDPAVLKSHKQIRLARLSLVYIAAAYIWQDGNTNVKSRLPKSVAQPLWSLSKRLDYKPIASNPDCVLANWTKIDQNGPLEISNLRHIVQFPGDISAGMFFLIPVQIELDCIPGVKAIVEALNSTDPITLIDRLEIMTAAITQMKKSLSLFHKYVDAKVFYNVVRPFLFGYGEDESSIPEGVLFEGVREERVKVGGGSAAQSTHMQCFDEALGIQHDKGKKSFLLEMRNYMPPKHKQLIEDIARARPSIRNRVENSNDTKVKEAYNKAVTALKELRSYHIQIVTKYVTIPSSHQQIFHTSDVGSGGQTIMPFLKGIRDTTTAHIIKDATLNEDQH